MPLPSLSSGFNPAKLLVPLVGVIVLGGGGALYLSKAKQLEQAVQLLGQARQQLAELKNQSEALQQQLSAIESSRRSLDESNASLRKELESAAADRDRFHSEIDEWRARYEVLERSKTSLETQVVGLAGERDDAKKNLEQVTNEKTELQRAAMRLRERLAMLDRDYRKLSDQLATLQATPSVSGASIIGTANPPSASTASAPAMGTLPSGTVELPPIVVRKDQAGMSMPVRGRLVEVNEPQQFLVVDKGSQDGVRVGMRFDIIRGSAMVGRATVVRVRPQLSACDILRAKTPGPIQVGDEAVETGS